MKFNIKSYRTLPQPSIYETDGVADILKIVPKDKTTFISPYVTDPSQQTDNKYERNKTRTIFSMIKDEPIEPVCEDSYGSPVLFVYSFDNETSSWTQRLV